LDLKGISFQGSGENYITRSFMICTAKKYNWNDKIEKNLLGGSCSTYGGKVYTGVWWGNLMERNRLGDPGVDMRIILRWIFRKWDIRAWTGSS
jgi:hypothetical protein